MSLKLITGIPGAGKTYLAVHFLVDQYFSRDSAGNYVLKPAYSDLQIISNIDDLALPHLSLSDALSLSKLDFPSFFSPSYQDKIRNKYPKVVYLIDEAQRYLPRKFYDVNTFLYFETHRHYGHDIFLITQDVYKLPRDITSLAETEIRAVRRSFSLFGEMSYNLVSQGDVYAKKVIKPKKSIYSLYRSMTHQEVNKVRSSTRKLVLVPLLGLLAFGLHSAYGWSQRGFLGQKGKSGSSSVSKGSSSIADTVSDIGKGASAPIPSVQWVQAAGQIIIGSELYGYIDPVTGSFVPAALAKGQYRWIGRDLWVGLDSAAYALYEAKQGIVKPVEVGVVDDRGVTKGLF